jgi:hypothetical protein
LTAYTALTATKAPLISRLTSDNTFDFVDAESDGPAAPGIAELYEPPYFLWLPKQEAPEVKKVHEFLQTIIKEDGPYDGILGFSEGAALAASFLLCHEHLSDSISDPPFKVAVFLNAVMLFSPSKEIGTKMTDYSEQAKKHDWVQAGQVDTPSDHSDVYEIKADNIDTRISIPTLHVIGEKDVFNEHSKALPQLCDISKAKVITVDAGHELPRSGSALQRIAAALETMVLLASLES